MENQDVLKSSDLQYGFKSEGNSPVLCNKHQSVYAMMLNASKAFDRVQYVKLFIVLIRQGMWPIMVRFLVTLYTNQQYVKSNDVI